MIAQHAQGRSAVNKGRLREAYGLRRPAFRPERGELAPGTRGGADGTPGDGDAALVLKYRKLDVLEASPRQPRLPPLSRGRLFPAADEQAGRILEDAQ